MLVLVLDLGIKLQMPKESRCVLCLQHNLKLYLLTCSYTSKCPGIVTSKQLQTGAYTSWATSEFTLQVVRKKKKNWITQLVQKMSLHIGSKLHSSTPIWLSPSLCPYFSPPFQLSPLWGPCLLCLYSILYNLKLEWGIWAIFSYT